MKKEKFEGLNKIFEEAEREKDRMKKREFEEAEREKDRMSKKKVTLYPDDRKAFYSEFEEFLLVNSNLILLIGIIVLFSLFIIGCLLAIPYFQGEHVYNYITRGI